MHDANPALDADNSQRKKWKKPKDSCERNIPIWNGMQNHSPVKKGTQGQTEYVPNVVTRVWNMCDWKEVLYLWLNGTNALIVPMSFQLGEKYIEQEFNAESFSAETVVDCSNFTDDMRHHDWNVVDVYSHNGGELHSFEMVCQKCGNKAVLKPEEGLIAFAHYKGANSYPTYPDFIKLSAESFAAGQKGYKQVTSRRE